jgi:hypothetical protein
VVFFDGEAEGDVYFAFALLPGEIFLRFATCTRYPVDLTFKIPKLDFRLVSGLEEVGYQVPGTKLL